MSEERYLSRVKVIVNMYDLENDSDFFIEQDFEECVNSAIEEIEELGAEVMTINFSVKVSGVTLVKMADIEFSLTEEQLGVTKAPEVPKLAETAKKITEEVFDYVQAKSEQGLEPAEIVKLFADDGQKISEFTVRKMLNTAKFSEYYAK